MKESLSLKVPDQYRKMQSADGTECSISVSNQYVVGGLKSNGDNISWFVHLVFWFLPVEKEEVGLVSFR